MAKTIGTELDLSQPADAKEVADLFGGEAYFRKTYPQLYTLFQNAQKVGTNQNSVNQGYQNSAYIVDVVYDRKNRCACASGVTYLTENAKRLYCNISIFKDGEIIGRSSEFYSNTDHARIACSSVVFDEPQSPVMYKGILYVAWQPDSQNQLHVMKATELHASVEGSGEEFIDTLRVDDPAYKKSTSGPIKVALWRMDRNVDYDYPRSRIDDDGNYEMHLKMAGNALLADNHSIGRISNVFAVLNKIGSGSVFYDHKIGESELVISSDRKTLTWDLCDNWENAVPESIVAGSRNYDFDMYIEIFCNYCQAEHRLIISSNDFPQYREYKFYKQIPQINVLWGCLAEGTRITMADGFLKKVEEIQIGDFVRTSDGTITAVKNVVVGTEETMYQLCLENGRSVMATITHPFLSENGMVSAMDLTSRTKLKTEDDTFSPVRACYPVSYGRSVYSLETESGAAFFANGIVSGTHSDQGSLSQKEKAPVCDLQVNEEIAQLRKDADDGKIFGGIRL